MGKIAAVVGGVLLVLLLIGGGVVMGVASQYNKSVGLDEACKKAAADVQAAYQRRMDLLPNLCNVVQGYAAHERTTLQLVTEARSMKPTITLTKDVLNDPDAMKQFQKAQGDISNMVSRLISVSEAYPNLKADAQFLELEREIAGTENRINIARRDYNEAVQNLNVNVRGFFSSIAAGMAGVHQRTPFEADDAAQHAPALMAPPR